MFSVRALKCFSNFAKVSIDIIAELELVNNNVSPVGSAINIVLPSSSSIGKFWPESQQSVALPHDLQKAVTTPLAAVYIGFSLLHAVAGTKRQEARILMRPQSFEHHLPWIIDSTVALWAYFRRWTTVSDQQPLRDDVISLHLLLIESLVVLVAEPTYNVPSSPKIPKSLVCILGSFLETLFNLALSEPNQIQLASILLNLRGTPVLSTAQDDAPHGRAATTRSAMLHDLETSVARTCQNVDLMISLHRDLQVCKKDGSLLPSIADDL